MKIQNAIEEFLQQAFFEKGLQKTTIEDYKEDFKSFLSYFPNIKDTSDLTNSDIANYVYKMGLDELKVSTINRRISTIKNFYIYLETEGFANEIVKDIYIPKKEKHIPNVLTLDEVDRLLDAPDPNTKTGIRDKAMLEIMHRCFTINLCKIFLFNNYCNFSCCFSHLV